MVAGHGPEDFEVQGRAAKDQGDFGPDVGVADCACVNQFGTVDGDKANNAKYYSGAVVKSRKTGQWYVYLEWGRIFAGRSWEGGFHGQDYQFVQCNGEADARDFFADQLKSKNIKRVEQKVIAGVTVWAAKAGKDGYLVQSLATRERGLPDCYKIKDSTGIAPKPVTPLATPKSKKDVKTPTVVKPLRSFQPQVIALAQALVGGVRTYTKALAAASGVSPTMDAITNVRDNLIPAALQRIKIVGTDVEKQIKDIDLRDLSKMVSALVPRPIPRTGMDEREAILNTDNILRLQQDLDTFESSLQGESFDVETTAPSVDPDSMLSARLTWLDISSGLGEWVAQTYMRMSRNRHSNVRSMRVINVFSVERPDRDSRFLAATNALAASRKGQQLGDIRPELQPSTRPDITDIGALAREANVFLGIHGTRSVNVSPILSTHFRMPKSLIGVQIQGAAFGSGVYVADDRGKSAQYVGASASVYGSGGGIRNRGNFMFLCDVAGGKFFYPTQAWGIGDRCPNGCDTVYAHPSRCYSLQNNEYVCFQPERMRIRYLVEVAL